jgi:hypothetical protein
MERKHVNVIVDRNNNIYEVTCYKSNYKQNVFCQVRERIAFLPKNILNVYRAMYNLRSNIGRSTCFSKLSTQ